MGETREFLRGSPEVWSATPECGLGRLEINNRHCGGKGGIPRAWSSRTRRRSAPSPFSRAPARAKCGRSEKGGEEGGVWARASLRIDEERMTRQYTMGVYSDTTGQAPASAPPHRATAAKVNQVQLPRVPRLSPLLARRRGLACGKGWYASGGNSFRLSSSAYAQWNR